MCIVRTHPCMIFLGQTKGQHCIWGVLPVEQPTRAMPSAYATQMWLPSGAQRMSLTAVPFLKACNDWRQSCRSCSTSPTIQACICLCLFKAAAAVAEQFCLPEQCFQCWKCCRLLLQAFFVQTVSA